MLPGYPARMEKDAAGCPSLLLHYGIMNPGTRRTSPAVYPTSGGLSNSGVFVGCLHFPVKLRLTRLYSKCSRRKSLILGQVGLARQFGLNFKTGWAKLYNPENVSRTVLRPT